jgi:hypothetical protein
MIQPGLPTDDDAEIAPLANQHVAQDGCTRSAEAVPSGVPQRVEDAVVVILDLSGARRGDPAVVKAEGCS